MTLYFDPERLALEGSQARAILQPLADALGLSVDGRLNHVLLPPSWRLDTGTPGWVVTARGRRSGTSWCTSAAAAVVADDLWSQAPKAYGQAVVDRGWRPVSPRRVRGLLRAAVTSLLLGGHATAAEDSP